MRVGSIRGRFEDLGLPENMFVASLVGILSFTFLEI
jgi:hypothetical protein